MKSRKALLILVVSISLCINACNHDRSLRWTEDVLLPDGRTVTLTRYQEFKGWRDIGQEATESDYWFEFKHPDTGERVRWQYGRDLATAALMIDSKTVYLLLRVRFGGSMHRLDCPNPPYFLYRFRNAKWEKVDLTEIPFKQFRSNVTYAPGDFRREIERNHHRYSWETQESYIFNHLPWYMDFSELKIQSFGQKNCYKDDPQDYLIKALPSTQGTK